MGKIKCFDPHASADNDHTGQNVKVALKLLAFRPAKPTNEKPGLYKTENEGDCNYKAVGDVTKIVDAEDSENSDIILNINGQKFVVTGLNFDKQLEGDRIELENSRIDLKSIENS